VSAARVEAAPAKVNLTLRVLGRRADGYHEIESLVVFADVGDTLTLAPARELALAVAGPTAAAAGDLEGNLVLKAARALAERVPGIKVGRFELTKRLPVAAGLGGGSSDAGAALRLLAYANQIPLHDPRLIAAARACGADVPVCLDPRPRVMRGIGEILSMPVALPSLPAVLVNPRVAVPTKDVFVRLGASPLPPTAEPGRAGPFEAKLEEHALFAALAADRNDLEVPAIASAPVIADVLASLRTLPNCRLARMSGSGATCFALFDSQHAAVLGAQALQGRQPSWWVNATVLGDQSAA
jgi:4-diphosphocytidyl-2-C-methyl-D-erythritol kinase